jgi:hypothetical protein
VQRTNASLSTFFEEGSGDCFIAAGTTSSTCSLASLPVRASNRTCPVVAVPEKHLPIFASLTWLGRSDGEGTQKE